MNRLFTLAFSIAFLFSCTEEDTPEQGPEDTLSVEDFSTTLAENPENNAVLGTLDVTTNVSEVSYAITAESPAGAMAVSQSGELSVLDSALFDFEINPTLTATVTVTAGELTETSSVTVTLTDVDEGGDAFVIYTGDKITFTKADDTDATVEANQDRITDNVWITRDATKGIYNIKTETAYASTSPADTEWAVGTTEDIASLTFTNWESAGSKPPQRVDVDYVLHLITDDVYIDIKFTSWSDGRTPGKGGFSYERSTPGE